MMRHHLRAAFNDDGIDLLHRDTVFGNQRAGGFDQHVRGDVTWITLETDFKRFPSLLQSEREPLRIAFEAKSPQKSVTAFKHGCGTRKSVLRQSRGQDATFRPHGRGAGV